MKCEQSEETERSDHLDAVHVEVGYGHEKIGEYVNDLG